MELNERGGYFNAGVVVDVVFCFINNCKKLILGMVFRFNKELI